MRFTAKQYDDAMLALANAKCQLEADGACCSCCGDSGHQSFECGHNPLVAMAMCEKIARDSDTLHQTLHNLAGYSFHMGQQLGPARVMLPLAKEAEAE